MDLAHIALLLDVIAVVMLVIAGDSLEDTLPRMLLTFSFQTPYYLSPHYHIDYFLSAFFLLSFNHIALLLDVIAVVMLVIVGDSQEATRMF